MAKVGQYVVTYSNGEDQVYSNSNQANALRIGFELLHQLEGWDKYELAMEAYSHIDEIVAEGKENCLPAAREWAQKVKDEPVALTLKEFEVLCVLIRHQGNVFTRAQLLDEI